MLPNYMNGMYMSDDDDSSDGTTDSNRSTTQSSDASLIASMLDNLQLNQQQQGYMDDTDETGTDVSSFSGSSLHFSTGEISVMSMMFLNQELFHPDNIWQFMNASRTPPPEPQMIYEIFPNVVMIQDWVAEMWDEVAYNPEITNYVYSNDSQTSTESHFCLSIESNDSHLPVDFERLTNWVAESSSNPMLTYFNQTPELQHDLQKIVQGMFGKTMDLTNLYDQQYDSRLIMNEFADSNDPFARLHFLLFSRSLSTRRYFWEEVCQTSENWDFFFNH